MTCYFFNVVGRTRIDDEEGQELPDDTSARAEALRSARSMMSHAVSEGRLPLHESIEIVANGAIVAVVTFEEAVSLGD